jgi:acyl carrier protein
MTETLREAILAMLREMNYDVPEDCGSLVFGSEGLDLESLAVAELAMRIEDQYGMRLDEEEASGIAALTFDEFVSAVSERLATGPAHADQVG